MKKYDPSCFSVQTLYEASDADELERKEIELIAEFDTMVPNGYNLKSGGYDGHYPKEVRDGMSSKRIGVKATDEARANMSKAQKGRPRTESQLEALRKSNAGNKHCLGRVLTQDQKDKISRGNLGKVRSDSTRATLSRLNSGDNHPQADKTIYEFLHADGASLTGTRCQFKEYTGFSCGTLFGKNKRPRHKGWRIA